MDRETTALPLALIAALSLVGCEAARDEVATAQGHIVNGTVENGWPAAGALTLYLPGWGYYGAYCSGTLIAPRWVLTAAHCVTAQQQGMPMMPEFVRFYVGTNAKETSKHGPPATGKLYQAKAFFPHPNYDPNDLSIGYDIGLVELEQEVTDVEPLPINTEALRGEHYGRPVLYVGFGQSDGKTGTGSGVKRSTTMPITWVTNPAYYTEPQGSGTCFGDSGGPGLLEMAPGDWRVVGVVSAGASAPGAGDPCLTGYGIYSRVDAYASWIAKRTGISLPDCSTGLCLCPEACGADGACDNSLCQTLRCPAALRCSEVCPADDAGCWLECHERTHPDDQAELEKVDWCMEQNCPDATVAGPDRLACAKDRCAKPLEACLATAAGTMDCQALEQCRRECPAVGSLCLHACEAEADPAAVEAYATMTACLQSKCDAGTDPAGVVAALASECARDACAAEVEGCIPAPPPEPEPEVSAEARQEAGEVMEVLPEDETGPQCDPETGCADATRPAGGGCTAGGASPSGLLLMIAPLVAILCVRPRSVL